MQQRSKSTAAPSEETTAVSPGRTPGSLTEFMQRKKRKSLNAAVMKFVSYSLVSLFVFDFLFHVATQESTVVAAGEATAVPPGRQQTTLFSVITAAETRLRQLKLEYWNNIHTNFI